MNNENYNKLETQIERLLSILDEMNNYSQSILTSKKFPLIDLAYFWHIFEYSYNQIFILSDLLDQVKALRERDTQGRKKYLLTR